MTPLAASLHLSDLGPGEWVVVGLASAAAVWTIWKAVRLTLHPGETAPDHWKRMILEEPPSDPPAAGRGLGRE